MSSLRRALLLAVLSGVGLAQEADFARRIDALVADLGSEDYRRRNGATKELEEIGLPALEALRRAAVNPDAEVAARARALIAQIECDPEIVARSFREHPFQFRLVASDEELAQERSRLEAEPEAYRPPAGRVRVPVRESARDRAEMLLGHDTLLEATAPAFFGHQMTFRRERIPSHALAFEFQDEAQARTFSDFTEANRGRRLAILYMGEVVSAPVIKERLEGSGLVECLTEQEVSELLALAKGIGEGR